jgi:hypothetical protein
METLAVPAATPVEMATAATTVVETAKEITGMETATVAQAGTAAAAAMVTVVTATVVVEMETEITGTAMVMGGQPETETVEMVTAAGATTSDCQIQGSLEVARR